MIKLNRIALFTDGFHPFVIGGMQRHSFYLIRYLARCKIHILLYYFVDKKVKNQDLKEVFSSEELEYIESVPLHFPKGGSMPGHYLRSSYAYSKLIFDHFSLQPPVDFVYAKGFTAWKLLEERKKGFMSPPIAVNFHGYEMFQKPQNIRAWLEQVLILKAAAMYNVENADFLFSYGGKITELLLSIGVSHERILEVPSGIDQSWLIPEPASRLGKIRFLFMGRDERRKGLFDLMSAIKNLPSSIEFEFHFIGPLRSFNSQDCTEFHFHGEVREQLKLQRLVSSCDVLVCPSHAEGMPNVILEAMASGLAVIATDVGAVRLMVDKTNGWLIEPGNTQELKCALTAAAGLSSVELQNLKTKSLEKISNHFLWEKIIDRNVSVISNALGNQIQRL